VCIGRPQKEKKKGKKYIYTNFPKKYWGQQMKQQTLCEAPANQPLELSLFFFFFFLNK
jgi:hypothetical protein